MVTSFSLSNSASFNPLSNPLNLPLFQINNTNQTYLENDEVAQGSRTGVPLLNLRNNPIEVTLPQTSTSDNFVSDLSDFKVSVDNNNQLATSSFSSIPTSSDRVFLEQAEVTDFNQSPIQTPESNQGTTFDVENLEPIQHAGSVTSQGNIATNANIVSEQFGFTGEGVTVGVLSDSFNSVGGASRDIASGDLPEDINVLSDLQRGGTDEGRAMLQLIHDVAPNADLAFHTAAGGKGNFAQGILELAEAGADIIVDDVAYLNEPFFQDGIISQAINQVTEQGVTYFSAAGNSGRQSYQSEFRPSNRIFDLGNFQLEAHDFNPGAGVDLFQELTIPQGEQVQLSFQWDERFPRLSGGNGAENDVDILLLNDDKTRVLEGSFEANQGRNPLEILSFTNDGSFESNTFNLAIGKTLNSESPDLMKYIGFGNLSINEFDTNSSTVFGHANAEGATAVGAASFTDTPAFGTNPPEVEEFSSAGGTPILFDNQGNRLPEPEFRENPDIVAPDGTNTTFFGNDIAADADSDPNFFGTSAAAPHAAGVAALLKEADPSLTPSEINQLLETTAIDMDDPSTPGFDTGFDPVTGHGFIQADEALTALETNQQTLTASDSLTLDGDGEAEGSTDGVLARYLFGSRGDALVNNAIAPDATRDSADAIESLGKHADNLADNVIGNGATRPSAEEVQEYLEDVLPSSDLA